MSQARTPTLLVMLTVRNARGGTGQYKKWMLNRIHDSQNGSLGRLGIRSESDLQNNYAQVEMIKRRLK